MTDPLFPSIDAKIGARLDAMRRFLGHEKSVFRFLDLKAVEIQKNRTVFSATLPEAFSECGGAAHSSAYAIILDTIFGLTVFTAFEGVKPIATINLRTDNLRACAAGTRIRCAATCGAVRDDIAYVSGNLTREETGELLATGAGAFMIGTKGPMEGMRP